MRFLTFMRVVNERPLRNSGASVSGWGLDKTEYTSPRVRNAQNESSREAERKAFALES
jgi:hypothetical protein